MCNPKVSICLLTVTQGGKDLPIDWNYIALLYVAHEIIKSVSSVLQTVSKKINSIQSPCLRDSRSGYRHSASELDISPQLRDKLWIIHSLRCHTQEIMRVRGWQAQSDVARNFQRMQQGAAYTYVTRKLCCVIFPILVVTG